MYVKSIAMDWHSHLTASIPWIQIQQQVPDKDKALTEVEL